MGRIGQIGVALGLVVLLGWVPLLLGLQELGYDGTRVQPTQGTTFQGKWVTVAKLVGREGLLAADEQTWAAVKALHDVNDSNVAIWQVPLGANYAVFRYQIDADGDDANVAAYTARAGYDPNEGTERDQRDDFNLTWEWDLTGGAKVGPNSNVYCDALAATTERWPSLGTPVDAGANDGMAQFVVDVRGVRFVALLRTDSVAGKTLWIDASIH